MDVKGSGTVGLISYLRTDSTRISEEADAAARTYISEQYGLDYVSQTEKAIKNGQKIQDAHEAIRPTDIARTPVLVKESLTMCKAAGLCSNPFISADLETFCGKQNGTGTL